jgi:predicted polyphosphate/ATP-dependent NAD kinase
MKNNQSVSCEDYVRAVGIIVNPASGKDIRRIIANGTVVTNQEKINIVIRMLLAMDALGVEKVFIMPDPTHIGLRVLGELNSDLSNTLVEILEMPYIIGTYKDSLRASQQMQEQNFACIIVMGGDGTCRVVAKTCGDVPLVPVSTGTNNVFPQMVEGTLAGMAAGVIATQRVSISDGCYRAPVLELRNAQGEVADTALVDLAVLNSRDLGSRAVWEPDSIRELFLTTASPAKIGLSSIGGWLHPIDPLSGEGLHIELGEQGHTQVMAPIAPGLIHKVCVEQYRMFKQGEFVEIGSAAGVIALDGEREVLIRENEKFTVNISPDGPMVVDLNKTLESAASQE